MPKTINLKTGKLVTKKPLVKPIKQSIKFVTEPKDTVKMRCQTDLEYLYNHIEISLRWLNRMNLIQ